MPARPHPPRPALATIPGRWLLVIPVVATTLVYYRITRNYFREDDFVNFYFIANYGPGRFLITVWAEHALVARNAIWWVLHALVGTRPEPYFVLTFVTHLAAVGLVFEALRRLTRNALAACVMASVWGTAPVHEEAIGWFSVYGQLVATALVAWLLCQLADLRDGAALGARRAALWAVLVLVVTTSFGVGLGIAFGLPVLAAVALPPSATRRRAVLTLALLAGLAYATYTTLIVVFRTLYGPFPHLSLLAALNHPDALATFFGFLAGSGILALHASPVAAGIPAFGATWWTGVVAWCLLVLYSFARVTPGERRVMLAGLVLAASCYAAFAGGRAPYVAKGMDFGWAQRYHYAATVGLALVTTVVVARLVPAAPRVSLRQAAGLAAVAIALVAAVVRFRPPINHHDYERADVEHVLASIREEVARVPAGSDVYIQNQPFWGVGPVLATLAMPTFPGWAAVFAIFFPSDTVDGRRVHFVADEAIVRAAQQGRRSAGLLVVSRP